jgi:cellulose synthase/poly-beta-1,6-N-acetylglucosamine synthase-like glycosyltransferase
MYQYVKAQILKSQYHCKGSFIISDLKFILNNRTCYVCKEKEKRLVPALFLKIENKQTQWQQFWLNPCQTRFPLLIGFLLIRFPKQII